MVSSSDTWLCLTPEPAIEAKQKVAETEVEKAVMVPNIESYPESIEASSAPMQNKPDEKASAKPKLWSEIMASPPAASAFAPAASQERPIPSPVVSKSTVSKVSGINSASNTGSTPATNKSTPTAASEVSKADTAAAVKPVSTPTMTREQALALPEKHFQDKVTRTNNLMHDIYDKNMSLSAAATKNGFFSAEEAGIALAVFGIQAKRMLKDRRVYKETMLLAMAKDKDGYSGRDMGELYTEAWKERKEADSQKAEKGLKRNEGQWRARERDRDMKRAGPMPGLDEGKSGNKSRRSGRGGA